MKCGNLALAIVLLSAGVAHGQASYPMLMDLAPLAARIGETSEHDVRSRYTLDGAYQVIVTGAGVSGEVVQPPASPPPAAPPALAMQTAKPAAKTTEAKTGPIAKTAAPTKAVATTGGSQPANAAAAKTPAKPPAKEPVKAPVVVAPAKKPDVLTLRVRFTVSKDALPGVRDFRIVTPQGVTTLGQLVLTRDPIVREQPKNNTLAEAQTVPLPATVCGVIEANEDVDFYKFHVDAGQALTFHVRSARCEDKIHDLQIHADPIISLKNASGTVLAMSDNYFFADPLLHYKFARAGDYFLEMRDVRFQGNLYWQYAIEINDRPLVTNVFPLAVTPEKPTRLELVGFNLPAQPIASITLPGNTPLGPQWVDLGVKPPSNPAPIVVLRDPPLVQTPGNHAPQKAQEIPIPCAVNGRIASPGQIDYYSFQAKKGERFSFEVIARRHESALDPILRILNAKGLAVIENDDMVIGRLSFPDSQIENWTAPADGLYVLELRDLHLRGGPQYVYCLEAARSEPYFLLELDSDKTILAPGTFGVIFVRVYRKQGFTGEVQLHIDGLPSGVTAQCGRILDGATDGCIVLQATAKASLGAANVQVTGTAKFAVDGKSRDLAATASPLQETYLPGGGRGLYPVELHTVSVGKSLDLLAVKVAPTQVTLKPGGTQKITITLVRSPEFNKNVTLDLMNQHLGGIFGNSLPPGVKIDDKKSKTLLAGSQTEGYIVLAAAADAAAVEKQLVPVVANVAVNFVMKMSYVGQPLLVSVEKAATVEKK